MENDELYPTGWSHRKFFPPRKNNSVESGNPNKRQNIDLMAALIEGEKDKSTNA